MILLFKSPSLRYFATVALAYYYAMFFQVSRNAAFLSQDPMLLQLVIMSS